MGGGDDFTVHSTQHCRHPTRPSILSVTVFSEHRHHDLSLSEIRLILSKDDPDGEVQGAARALGQGERHERSGRRGRSGPGAWRRVDSTGRGGRERSRWAAREGCHEQKRGRRASTRSGGRSPGRHNPYGRLFSDFAKNLENPNLELIHTSHYTVHRHPRRRRRLDSFGLMLSMDRTETAGLVWQLCFSVRS